MNRVQFAIYLLIDFVVFVGMILWGYFSGDWNKPNSIQVIVMMVCMLAAPIGTFFYKGGFS